MCRSRGESASEWIFSSFRKGSRKWGGAQNWTLAKSFLFCVLSLALAKPWDCLKIILNPFQLPVSLAIISSSLCIFTMQISGPHPLTPDPCICQQGSFACILTHVYLLFILTFKGPINYNHFLPSQSFIHFFFFQIMPLLFSPLSTWLCLYPWLSSRCFHLLFAYPNTVISWSLPSLPNLAPWGTLFYFIFSDHLMLQSLMYWVK